MDKINGDRKEFLELLEEVSEIAGVQGRSLTLEELKAYFKDLDLSEEKLQAILRYFEEKKQEEPPSGAEKQKSGVKDKAYLAIYRKELKNMPSLEEAQEIEILEMLLTGREEARQTYTESKLSMVLELVEKYQKRNMLRGVPVEEVIQEANLALLSAIAGLPAAAAIWRQTGEGLGIAQADSYLEREVRSAIELHIDGEISKRDLESAVVAKSNLIHEAEKYLAEDFGRMPTLAEIAAFTKIPEQEIADMKELARQGERYGAN